MQANIIKTDNGELPFMCTSRNSVPKMNLAREVVPAAIRRRYAVKFGIALLVLGLSVGAIGFVATAGITDEVEDRVHGDHESFATQEAQSLEMWNEQNEHTVGMIAWSDSVHADDVDAIEFRFLNWQEHLDGDIFRMDYVDTANGTVLTSTQGDLRPEGDQTIAASELGLEDDAFESAAETVEGVPWVSKPYLATDEHGQEAAVVTYVLDVPRMDDRAIVYTADLEAYATNFQDTDRVTTLVLDGDDEVMLDSTGLGGDYDTFGASYDDGVGVSTLARTEGPGVERVTDDPAEVLAHDTYGFDTDDYVASYAQVHGTDWVVAIHEPTDDAYGFVTTVDQYGTAATLLGILLIGMVGAVLGRNTAVSIDRLTEKAGRMERGDLDVSFETERIDNIGRLYAGFASMRDALRAQIDEAVTAREAAERERERVQALNEDLELAAAEYGLVMEDAAAGDLTSRMDPDATENDTMHRIARDFNEMLAEIEVTVAELSRFAEDVSTASEEVTASSEAVRAASRKVTGSIQEISNGAERQNTSLQAVDNEMSGLSTTIQGIAASSNQVADIASRTVDTGREGQVAAHEAIDAMTSIEEESAMAVEEIRRLEAEVRQIDELINAISGIAKQTNMLALNANIEASRSAAAEEAGDGFAVVAKEVKELSEDVAAAAEEAEERLESIRSQTTKSAAEVERTSEKIDDAGGQVQSAVDALEEIVDFAKETNEGVQEISAATEEQAATTEQVVAMVDDAGTISEETTSEAETVAAAAEEQTAELTEVSHSASVLATQAGELSEALDRFETESWLLDEQEFEYVESGEIDRDDDSTTDEAYEPVTASSDDSPAGSVDTSDSVDGEASPDGVDESETSDSDDRSKSGDEDREPSTGADRSQTFTLGSTEPEDDTDGDSSSVEDDSPT